MMNKKFIMKIFILGCISTAVFILGCNDANIKDEPKTDIKIEASEDIQPKEVKHSTDNNILIDTAEYKNTDKPIVLDDYNGVTISEAGTYVLTGKLENGQVIVDADVKDEVTLVLDSVSINCESSDPIYINSAKKIIISPKDYSSNYIKLQGGNIDENINKNLYGIYSLVDMEIRGESDKGVIIEITSEYGGGINSHKNLLIQDGEYIIESENTGILADNKIDIKDAKCIIYSDGHGVYTNGNTIIERSDIDVSSKNDCITSVKNTNLFESTMTGYSMNNVIYSSGEVNIIDSNTIMRGGNNGISTESKIVVSGSRVAMNTDDDAIKVDENINVLSSDIDITSEASGINAKYGDINVEDGRLFVREGEHGIVGSNITINNVEVYIKTEHYGICTVGKDADLDISKGDIMLDCDFTAISIDGDMSLKETNIFLNTKENPLDADSKVEVKGEFTSKDSVIMGRDDHIVNIK